jgi:hypothetical protein
MKRNWTIDELIDHWTLTPGEREMTKRAIGVNNQLGRALLLKWFQYAGRVPQRKQEIPSAVVQFLARQLEVSPDVFHEFLWNGGTIERQRAKIRCPIAENVAAGDSNVCFTPTCPARLEQVSL